MAADAWSAAARTATETRRPAAGARAEARAEFEARREKRVAGAPATACVTADIASVGGSCQTPGRSARMRRGATAVVASGAPRGEFWAADVGWA